MTTNAEGSKALDDKVVYFGVININEGTKTIGAIDVWRSIITKEFIYLRGKATGNSRDCRLCWNAFD